jgi:hypothetical protein
VTAMNFPHQSGPKFSSLMTAYIATRYCASITQLTTFAAVKVP